MTNLPRFISCPEKSFFLFGPRGTGKSTWLRMRFPDALFVDLLSHDLSRRLLARPERLREIVEGNADKCTFVIDEVQRAPQLLDVVHQMIESRPELRFVLTGSSARKLKRSGIDLLAGRAVLTTCHPFMAAELGDAFSLESALADGLVPLVLAAADRRSVLRTYLEIYLREEIQAEGFVRNLSAFARFLEAISFSQAALLTVSEIARECAVSRTTVCGYLSILEDMLISTRLPIFSKRAKRRLVGHDKFFIFDAGVFRILRPTGPLDRQHEIDGAALEGLVFQHLRAWNDYSGKPCSLHFWRTRAGLEVDFVVYGADEFTAIEVKNAAQIRPSDLSSLRAFGDEYPEARLTLLHRGKEQYLANGVLCVPCERFLCALTPGKSMPDAAWRR
jgi:predicted AAA+ superfamily ATPase